jgi:hypothetical protein
VGGLVPQVSILKPGVFHVHYFGKGVVFIPTEVYLMSNIEKLSDALRDYDHKRKLRDPGLSELRKRWLEAVADDSEGLDPDEVFDRLETKYNLRAKDCQSA